MKSQFYLLLSLKTPTGFEAYGQYFLGDDREFAAEIFAGLKGDNALINTNMLHLDLMETVNELPVRIKTICCTLDELAWNCKHIAREIFRLYAIKQAL